MIRYRNRITSVKWEATFFNRIGRRLSKRDINSIVRFVQYAPDSRHSGSGQHQSQIRVLLDDTFGVGMQLLTSDKPVNFTNDRWDLRDARLHLRSYSNPFFDVAVAAVASPTGPKLAGRYGVGLLSIGATTAPGFDALARCTGTC